MGCGWEQLENRYQHIYVVFFEKIQYLFSEKTRMNKAELLLSWNVYSLPVDANEDKK